VGGYASPAMYVPDRALWTALTVEFGPIPLRKPHHPRLIYTRDTSIHLDQDSRWRHSDLGSDFTRPIVDESPKCQLRQFDGNETSKCLLHTLPN
jgi:hypothetical protein